MKYSLSEVKAKTRRENAEENKNLHPLASRLSIYFSWIFINLGLSPGKHYMMSICNIRTYITLSFKLTQTI